MAPEVILGEADVDARADVYAIGCLAYWMLTGQRVFESDSTTKLLIDHVNTPPVPPSERTELAIPREFEKIVLACLEKDPDRRPQNAEELWRMSLELPVRRDVVTRGGPPLVGSPSSGADSAARAGHASDWRTPW